MQDEGSARQAARADKDATMVIYLNTWCKTEEVGEPLYAWFTMCAKKAHFAWEQHIVQWKMKKPLFTYNFLDVRRTSTSCLYLFV